ncbi:sperm-tail PG-rich repeat-containing protein 2-like [Ooceraea biroi]|uniref:sperm-tail PG-rich repeat-containing protein 2-like n=1 Tax=Ooceraea biroi TaxID=2015173 RepID=UPI000F076014|nr:sperm-tail PG-rich repeat-containing protein 2-like [Ooceraea biroi]
MAFDRRKRFEKLTTSTPARVGPGTYDISDLSKPLRDPENAYPFLNGASRQTLSIPKDSHKFPGPGSYNIEALRKRIPERAGGISIDYTDVRFKESIDKGSDPAKYTLPDDLFKETPRRIRSHPGTWRGPAGKLWLIRPPRPIMQTGLSVFPSSTRDFGGYGYDERGVLAKNPVIEQEPSDFYDVPRGETNFATLKYKGNFWSRMKGRDDERTSATPGPGCYEHETKKSPAQIHDERIREAKRAAAKQPRFLEALCRQKLRQNFPAPNYYDPRKSVFDKHKRISCKCDSYAAEPPPFNQTAKRFEVKVWSDTPGPDAYDVAIRQICYGSILNAPFGACSARFKKPVRMADTPDPGDYHTDIGNLAFESAKRFKGKHKKMTDYLKFYVTSTSMSDITSFSEEYALTDERKITDEGKCAVYHAVFKSRVERFAKIRKDDDGPYPGAYEALSAFKANRDRCDFLCRRLAPPFGSRASRFPTIPKSLDFHVPGTKRGPSHYDLRGDISKNVKYGVICYAPRERNKEIKGPGPSHYRIHPYIASSVLKKSFNITLDKSEIVKPSCKIQKSSCHRRSKKTSRYFVVPRRTYQHCVSKSLLIN